MNFTIGRWIITTHLRARHSWGYFKHYKFKDSTSQAIVWGRIWFEWEDWTAEVYPVCAECGSPEIGERGYGDEGLTVCEDCGSIEQGYKYVNLRDYESA